MKLRPKPKLMRLFSLGIMSIMQQSSGSLPNLFRGIGIGFACLAKALNGPIQLHFLREVARTLQSAPNPNRLKRISDAEITSKRNRLRISITGFVELNYEDEPNYDSDSDFETDDEIVTPAM